MAAPRLPGSAESFGPAARCARPCRVWRLRGVVVESAFGQRKSWPRSWYWLLTLEFSQDSRETAAMTDEQQEPVVVPHRELDRATLQAVIESFALREGTDYGEREYSL